MENIENNEEIKQQLNGNNLFINKQDQEVIKLTLTLSKQNFDQIKAGSFYNNYGCLEEFVVDTVIAEIEADKQRHLKSKQGNKGR